MSADSSAENTPNALEFFYPICLPKPQSSGFQWKKGSLGVRNPWATTSKDEDIFHTNATYSINLHNVVKFFFSLLLPCGSDSALRSKSVSSISRRYPVILANLGCIFNLSDQLNFLNPNPTDVLTGRSRDHIQITQMHRGAICHFPFRWIYNYGSNKFTGKESVKMHLCEMHWNENIASEII